MVVVEAWVWGGVCDVVGVVVCDGLLGHFVCV